MVFSWASNAALSDNLASFQKYPPSLVTAITMFSGLVIVGVLETLGRATGTVLITTGIVIRKIISITNITSTSGVVLIVELSWSSPSPDDIFIPMILLALFESLTALN